MEPVSLSGSLRKTNCMMMSFIRFLFEQGKLLNYCVKYLNSRHWGEITGRDCLQPYQHLKAFMYTHKRLWTHVKWHWVEVKLQNEECKSRRGKVLNTIYWEKELYKICMFIKSTDCYVQIYLSNIFHSYLPLFQPNYLIRK